jgi:formylglycine-generating enzyme required for sulfatase activity
MLTRLTLLLGSAFTLEGLPNEADPDVPLPPEPPLALPYIPAPLPPPQVPRIAGPLRADIESDQLGRLICVPSGRFWMGSPADDPERDADEAHHEVFVSSFCAMETEVTQAMYHALTGADPARQIYDGLSLSGPSFPVQNVSWYDAVRFANAASAADGLVAAYRIDGERVAAVPGATGYRLLTEAEWEYVARAGEGGRYAGTDDDAAVCAFGNVSDALARAKWQDWNTFDCADGYAGLAPVALYAPNAWGFYDLTGNVSEWVFDGYGGYAAGPVRDPVAPAEGGQMVLRGGASYGRPGSQRVAFRDHAPPDTRFYLIGFRLARARPAPGETLRRDADEE